MLTNVTQALPFRDKITISCSPFASLELVPRLSSVPQCLLEANIVVCPGLPVPTFLLTLPSNPTS